jgi:hypothetical protein
MDMVTILFIIVCIGWGMTLYVYSKRFRETVDKIILKIKNKLDHLIEKSKGDNRKDSN